MTHFAQLSVPVAQVSASNPARVQTVFDTAQPASAFPDVQAYLVAADPSAQPNWYYDGTMFSATPIGLADVKAQKQNDLDAILDRVSINSLVRNGTLTTVTAAQVGSFLAAGANNYRTLRASIAAAASVSAVNAIDITSGWPSNP